MNRTHLAAVSGIVVTLASALPAQAQEFDVDAYCEATDAIPSDRRANFRQTLCANAEEIDANERSVNANAGRIAANAQRTGANAAAIMQNAAAIGANASSLMQQGMMIEDNRARLDGHDRAISNNSQRLDGHDRMLADHARSIGVNARAIDMVDERVSKVAAMAAALSAVPNAPTSQGGFFVGVGVGNHDGESGVAIGVSGCLGRPDVIFNAGVANSSGETTVRAGVGWSF